MVGRGARVSCAVARGGRSVLPVLSAVVLAAAAFAVVRRPRVVAVPLAATTVGLLAAAAYMRLRTGGELFVFKALGFGGVMVLGLAGVGLVEAARSRHRVMSAAAGVALGLTWPCSCWARATRSATPRRTSRAS